MNRSTFGRERDGAGLFRFFGAAGRSAEGCCVGAGGGAPPAVWPIRWQGFEGACRVHGDLAIDTLA